MKKLGFIGCGKMASAIINGILKSDILKKEDIIASEVNEDFAKTGHEKTGIEVICDNKKLAEISEIIFIAIKPHLVTDVLNEIKEVLNKKQLIISIAAGYKISNFENILPENPVIRIMPNAPLMFLEGMAGIAKGKNATDEHLKFVENIFSKIGKYVVVDEKYMNTITAISGSGPAYFFKFIEEIARAGEKMGLDYDKALTLSAQTALGSAKMVLDSGLDMQTLIKMITTKGGCTEVGVNYLEEIDLKDKMTKLIEKTEDKASKLG